MAQVSLTRAWLTPLDDSQPDVDLRVRKVSGGPRMAGEVRRYVNGRRRGSTRTGVDHPYEVETALVPLSKVDDLESLIGQTVRYRDSEGRAVWCEFYEVGDDPLPGVGLTRLTLTLREVTETDEV